MTHSAQRTDLQRHSLRHAGSVFMRALDPQRLRAGLVADALLDAMDLLDRARVEVERGDAQRTISALLAASASACAATALDGAPEERLREVFQQRRCH